MYHLIYFLQEPGQEMREANEGAKSGTIAVGKPLTQTERIIVGTMAVGASVALIAWAFFTLA